jgi:hypothetical protein
MVLEVQGIDVSQAMRWMKTHKALLDISANLVHLDSPVYGRVTLHIPIVARLQASIHTIVGKS